MFVPRLKTGPLALIYSSLFFVLFYKLYKYGVGQLIGHSYNAEELFFTIYRLFATVFGVLLIRATYAENEFLPFLFRIKEQKKIFGITFTLVLPLYFLFKLGLYQFNFDLKQFNYEMFFNFFTGTFEEIMFRGLLMMGLCSFMGPLGALVVSSLCFTFWHYDVISHWSDYLNIFSFSLYFGMGFFLGLGLFWMAMFHFLIDQVHFALFSERTTGLSFLLENLLFAVLALYFTNAMRRSNGTCWRAFYSKNSLPYGP